MEEPVLDSRNFGGVNVCAGTETRPVIQDHSNADKLF